MPPAFLFYFWCFFSSEMSRNSAECQNKSENFDRTGFLCCMNQYKPKGLMDVIWTEGILSEDTDLRYR